MEWNPETQRWSNGTRKVVTAAEHQGRTAEFLFWTSLEAVAPNPHWAPIFDEDPLAGLEDLKALMEQAPGDFDYDEVDLWYDTSAQEAGLSTLTEEELRGWADAGTPLE